MTGVGTGGFVKIVNNQMYVFMKRFLLAILMMTVSGWSAGV